MTRLPDPQLSRAVLIGASSYHSTDLPALPAVRNNLSGMASVFTAPERGALPRDHCTVIVDPGEPRIISAALREAGRRAEDTLLVYYAGHGLLGPRLDALYLATTGTALDDLRYSALHIDAVRETFLDSRATNRVLILDCCFSGRAIEHMMGNIEGLLLEKVNINGACVMASAPANWHALAPREARYTAYTGALLDLLREGIADGPEVLPIRLVHERLSQIMAARGLPEPQLSATNTVEQLGLVRNSAYQDPQSPEMSATTNPATVATRPALRAQARFQQRPGLGWFDRLIWRVATWGPLAAVIYSWHALQPAPRLVLAVVYAALSVFVLFFASNLYPTRYDLILDQEGIELVVGASRRRYPWHRIREVRLVPDRRHARRSRHILILELQPGTLPPEGRLLAPVPRWDETHDGIRFAETGRLAAQDDDIERALGRFAGTCWTPAIDISLTGDAWHYRARRTRLAVWAAVLLTLGLSPLLLWCGLLGGHMPIGALAFAAVLGAILSVPGVIVATWWRYPGGLKLDGEGIELALGGRTTYVPWHDVERARITGWIPEIPGDRFLAIRQWPSSRPHSSRITMPWTFRRAGTTVLCPVQVFAAHPDELRAGLNRFAGSAWEPGAGLHVPAEDTADRVRFTGRLVGPRALLGAAAVILALQLLGLLIDHLTTIPATASRFAAPFDLSVPIVELGLLAVVILLARDSFDLIVDADGLTLRIGRTPATILWDDIDRIAIIRSSSSSDGFIQTPWSSRSPGGNRKKKKIGKDRRYLVAWMRGEAAIPRRWWRILRLMRPVLGGVAIMELSAWQARLFANRTDLERALVRFAGARFISQDDASSQ